MPPGWYEDKLSSGGAALQMTMLCLLVVCDADVVLPVQGAEAALCSFCCWGEISLSDTMLSSCMQIEVRS